MRRGIKNLLFVLMIFLMPLMFSFTVNAQDKEVTVNLAQDYHNCTFWISASVGNVWTVSVYSPTNDLYDCSYSEEESAYYCDFEYLSAGEWKVVIHSENEIPHTQIAVKATVQDSEIGNVSVAKSVAGLQIYVVDNKVVVEWTDDTCGNLNIKVFDTDTFKVIADVKESDKYYECEFSETVDKITVTVVPAQSQNIDGAEYSVTLKANYTPNGTVVFSEPTIVNMLGYNCEVTIQQTYTILYEVNGTLETVGKYNAGTYPVTVPLEEGQNDIKIYLQEENGSRKSFSTSVECDLVKPSLVLNKEYDGTITNQNSITIEGTVSDFDKLTINGIEQEVADNGFFSSQCGLFSGSNAIEIIASDKAGNETTYIANVTQSEVKNNSSTISTIITLVIYAVIIFLVIKALPKLVKKKPKKENGVDKNERKE